MGDEAWVDEAKETRAVLFTAIAALGFAAIGIASPRDCELLSQSGKVGLPLLSVDVPVRTFFLVAPGVLFGIFLYAHAHLLRLAEKVKPTLDVRFLVWPLSELPYPAPGQGRLLSALTQLVVWGAWPAVAWYGAVRIAPLGDHVLTVVNVAFAVTATLLTVRYWMRAALGRPPNTRVLATFAVLGVMGLAALALLPARVFRTFPVNYSDFQGADMSFVDLSSRRLRGANFDLAHLDRARLSASSIARATFRGAHAHKLEIRREDDESDLSSVDFSDSDLTLTNFSGVKLRQLDGAILTHTAFWNATLRDAQLSLSVVSEANFSKSDATGANFDGATGKRPIFFASTLVAASFVRAALESPNFTGANLACADLAEASMPGASFAGSTLQDADLRGADLSGAYFDEATNTKGALRDQFTKLPEGFPKLEALPLDAELGRKRLCERALRCAVFSKRIVRCED